MPTEEAFLLTIKMSNDNGPRLVYADWLEEQGRTQEAEIIRLQSKLRELLQERGQSPYKADQLKIMRRLLKLYYVVGCTQNIHWPPTEEQWPKWQKIVAANLERFHVHGVPELSSDDE
jgi:uncharacterized protein (TIGR02996 family)